MPIRHIGSETYYLVCFDKYGQERDESDQDEESDETYLSTSSPCPTAYLSKTILELLEKASPPYTDIFFCSHGWQGDVPAAIKQYDKWITAMVSPQVQADIEAAKQKIKGFRSLIVGLHWPSLPWGDERIPAANELVQLGKRKRGEKNVQGAKGVQGAEEVQAAAPVSQAEVNACAASIADTSAAKDAIRTLLEAAQPNTDPEPTPEVQRALEVLAKEAGVDSKAIPGEERIPTEALSKVFLGPATRTRSRFFRDGFFSGEDFIISALRLLSFWTMKDRARIVGESGGHTLLRDIQDAAGKARIHLMGHSFGCIVVSAVIGGPDTSGPRPKSVTSLFLVQGALSLWSFASLIPYIRGPGHFYPLIKAGLVEGSYVTTQSSEDTAVGDLYPWAAWIAGQVRLLRTEPFPKYGGIGTFGIQGVPKDILHGLVMKPVDGKYEFQRKQVYNLDASNVIKNGPPPMGAHSDIAHPEVAHAFWAAVLA